MSLRNNFIEWYFNEFRLDDLYLTMDQTTEDSPWHRERTVGVHTDMVVSQYLVGAVNTDWDVDVLVGALACAFHDVGKPAAEVTKFSEERGEYRAYAGHEPISARLWEDWAARNWDFIRTWFCLDVRDIYRVGWMIENHLPWGLKKPEKLDNLSQTIIDAELGHIFAKVLMADTRGRIADDHATKIADSQSWVDGMMKRTILMAGGGTADEQRQAPRLIMPIGPSGAGKSTAFRSFYAETEPFSWDTLRLEWYLDGEEYLGSLEEMYAVAFQRSTKDKQFNQKANREFIDLVKTGVDIYVDNTNLTKKRRTFFLQEARRHGYVTEAVLMPISLDQVIERQQFRPDKNVPAESVKRQFMSVQLPWYGEFDTVRVVDSNLR